MKVWITRDGDTDFVAIRAGLPETNYFDEKRLVRETYYIGGCGARIMKTKFKNIFGFTPRKGSCKQYELTLNLIAEKEI